MATPTRATKMRRVEDSKGMTVVRTWGHRGSADGEFKFPAGIAVAADGTIVVADQGNNRIQCFDSTGAFIRKWGSTGNGDGQFLFPHGVAIGLVDELKKSILMAMNEVPELSALPPGLLPICAAYVGDERVYVTDIEQNRIQVFRMDGVYIRKWGSQGRENGQFDDPNTCCVDSNGIVYVGDMNNNRIQTFDSNGTFIWAWECSDEPQVVWTSGYGDGVISIYVVCQGCDLRCYHTNGTLCTCWGIQWRSIDKNLSSPGECTHGNDDDNKIVYIADTKNHCIYKYPKDGGDPEKFGSKGSGDGQFMSPWAIAKGSDGILYVTDTNNNRIVAVRMQVDI